jgi:hypothetical protein
MLDFLIAMLKVNIVILNVFVWSFIFNRVVLKALLKENK